MSETTIPKDLQGIYKQAEGDDHYYGHLTRGLIERIGRVEAEIQMVDEALARRPAVAESPNRYTAICAAFEMASRAQRAEAMEKHWKFHYERVSADIAQMEKRTAAAMDLAVNMADYAPAPQLIVGPQGKDGKP